MNKKIRMIVEVEVEMKDEELFNERIEDVRSELQDNKMLRKNYYLIDSFFVLVFGLIDSFFE